MNYNYNYKIYKIVCNISGDEYIGSTQKTLLERLKNHENKYKYYLLDNTKNAYYMSFDILARGNYDIHLIENGFTNNKIDMLLRERYYIEGNDLCVNKNYPITTDYEKKQYYKDNIVELTKKKKEIIKCLICDKTYTRTNYINHRRSKYHKEYNNFFINRLFV